MGSTQTLPGLRASARSPQGLCSGCCSVDLHPLQASLALDTPQPPMDGSTGGASSLPDHVFSSGPLFLRPSSILGVAAQGSAALEPGPSHHLTCAALPALTIPGVPLARARQGPVPLVQGPWVPPAGSTVPQELLEPPRHCSGVIPSLIHVLCHLTAPCVGAGSHSGSDFWDGTGAPGPGAGLGSTCWGSARLDGAVLLHPGVSHPSIPQFTSTPLPGSPPGHQGAPAEGGRAAAAPCPPAASHPGCPFPRIPSRRALPSSCALSPPEPGQNACPKAGLKAAPGIYSRPSCPAGSAWERGRSPPWLSGLCAPEVSQDRVCLLPVSCSLWHNGAQSSPASISSGLNVHFVYIQYILFYSSACRQPTKTGAALYQTLSKAWAVAARRKSQGREDRARMWGD